MAFCFTCSFPSCTLCTKYNHGQAYHFSSGPFCLCWLAMEYLSLPFWCCSLLGLCVPLVPVFLSSLAVSQPVCVCVYVCVCVCICVCVYDTLLVLNRCHGGRQLLPEASHPSDPICLTLPGLRPLPNVAWDSTIFRAK